MRTVMTAVVLGCLAIVGGVVQVYASEVKGEVIDTYCYASMGAKGEAHRSCAIACAKKGIPMGLLEDGTGKVYVLVPSKPATSLPIAVTDKMAQKVTINGKVYRVGGSQFLAVESIE